MQLLDGLAYQHGALMSAPQRGEGRHVARPQGLRCQTQEMTFLNLWANSFEETSDAMEWETLSVNLRVSMGVSQ